MALAAWQPPARAEVTLPALISDNMVLQQESRANVWGWADPGELVTVRFAGRSVATAADSDGNWSVQFEGLTAGTTGDLTISGGNTRTIKNVLVGEVWVCAGGPALKIPLRATHEGAREARLADFPQIRMFTVGNTASDLPQTHCAGRWQVCTPQNVAEFPATGYFFSRTFIEQIDSPVGLILAAAGDAPAEHWIPERTLRADPRLATVFEQWQAKELQALPQPPPEANQGGPARLFNGMIAPLIPYTIQGALWHPGEADIRQVNRYRRLFPALILSWRQAWGREFPFIFLQLGAMAPGPQDGGRPPSESKKAEFREAQRLTLDLRHTAMAVAIDLGEKEGEPPRTRREMGRRLALAAAATVYYRDTPYSGPMLSSSQEELGKIRLSFRHAENLHAAGGCKLKGFDIAGEDGRFFWADAEIQGDHVMVSHPQIPRPAAVRYGWADHPDCNLVNGAGLPASPFRTDWLEYLGTRQTAVPSEGADPSEVAVPAGAAGKPR
jgi:sialate O-acetylesterase